MPDCYLTCLAISRYLRSVTNEENTIRLLNTFKFSKPTLESNILMCQKIWPQNKTFKIKNESNLIKHIATAGLLPAPNWNFKITLNFTNLSYLPGMSKTALNESNSFLKTTDEIKTLESQLEPINTAQTGVTTSMVQTKAPTIMNDTPQQLKIEKELQVKIDSTTTISEQSESKILNDITSTNSTFAKILRDKSKKWTNVKSKTRKSTIKHGTWTNRNSVKDFTSSSSSKLIKLWLASKTEKLEMEDIKLWSKKWDCTTTPQITQLTKRSNFTSFCCIFRTESDKYKEHIPIGIMYDKYKGYAAPIPYTEKLHKRSLFLSKIKIDAEETEVLQKIYCLFPWSNPNRTKIKFLESNEANTKNAYVNMTSEIRGQPLRTTETTHLIPFIVDNWRKNKPEPYFEPDTEDSTSSADSRNTYLKACAMNYEVDEYKNVLNNLKNVKLWQSQ